MDAFSFWVPAALVVILAMALWAADKAPRGVKLAGRTLGGALVVFSVLWAGVSVLRAIFF